MSDNPEKPVGVLVPAWRPSAGYVKLNGVWTKIRLKWAKQGGLWRICKSISAWSYTEQPVITDIRETQEWTVPDYLTLTVECYGPGGGGGSGNATTFVPGANGNGGGTGTDTSFGDYFFAASGTGGQGGCYCSGVWPCCAGRGGDGSGNGQSTTVGGGSEGGGGGGGNNGQGGGSGGNGGYSRSSWKKDKGGPAPGSKILITIGTGGVGGPPVENGGRVSGAGADGKPGFVRITYT